MHLSSLLKVAFHPRSTPAEQLSLLYYLLSRFLNEQVAVHAVQMKVFAFLRLQYVIILPVPPSHSFCLLC